MIAECGVPGCPRDTTGYCEKCANPHGVGSELTYSQGFQAGLKRGAEIAAETREKEYGRGRFSLTARAAIKYVQQAILKELSEDCSPSVSPED